MPLTAINDYVTPSEVMRLRGLGASAMEAGSQQTVSTISSGTRPANQGDVASAINAVARASPVITNTILSFRKPPPIIMPPPQPQPEYGKILLIGGILAVAGLIFFMRKK